MSNAGETLVDKTELAYTSKPILFRLDHTEAFVFAMEEYKAGQGLPPEVGQEMALSVMCPDRKAEIGGKPGVIKGGVVLEGLYRVTKAQEDAIKSIWIDPNAIGFWGVEISFVRDIEVEDIERLESAYFVAGT